MNIADYRAAIPIHKNAIAGRRDFEQMKIVCGIKYIVSSILHVL